MASRNETLLSRTRKLLGRDERGSAMTEFVIVLPVFIFIFVGMLNLFKLELTAFRARSTAAHQTWVAAMEVHTATVDPTHTQPTLAAGQASSYIDEPHQGAGAAGLMNTGLSSNGSRGEAEGWTSFASAFGIDNPDPSDYPEPSEDFSEYITDDSATNALSNPRSELSVFSGSYTLSQVGPNQAHAAGSRYGAVEGSYTKDYSVGAGTWLAMDYSFTKKYDVLVSPTGVKTPTGVGGNPGDLLTTGFSRLSAEKDSCLRKVGAMRFSFQHLGGCW